jgi:phenylacetate-CoA ligase
MLDYLLCKIRNRAFWTLDSLKGRPIKAAYEEIKKIDNINSSDKYINNYHNQAFNKLAKHAIATTEYYKDIKIDSLNNFPVINKIIIKDSQNKFLSNKYKKDQLIQMSTSGSTGIPFVSYQDIGKKRRVNAEVIYYSEKAGYSVGKNLIFMRVITDKTYKSKLNQWTQNETLIDIGNLDDQKIELIIDKIIGVSRNGSMILAYASTYDVFRDYFIRNGYSITEKANIAGVISSSEMLFDNTRELMSKAFNCRVYSRYSNQENGIIGQDDEENNVFIINEADYIVEIFDMERDNPVSEGEIGRIVVTDLFNYAMPMIRYDTGDIGSITTINNNGSIKKAIINFGGRRIDVVYDSFGNRLSPHIITNNFWGFPEIKQYQFIQETKNEYTVKINVEGKFIRQDEVKEKLFSLLGNKAVVKIELIDEIPVMASGKRKYIINHVNNRV